MDSENLPTDCDLLEQPESWDLDWFRSKTPASVSKQEDGHWPFWINGSSLDERPNTTARSSESGNKSQVDSELVADAANMSLLAFVERSFVPEYVTGKRSAGRAHFQSILKHILTPEGVDRAFQVNSQGSRSRLRRLEDWPYMDSMPLKDVTREHVQQLISTALERGYSIQTATHIRNVIRTLFTHAKNARCFNGENPATFVLLPGMARKQPHSLTLDELKSVIQLMRYPEREIALLAILTKMSVAEICGLQWKYVNLSDARRIVDGDWLPARTIAIRKQSYRGEFGFVMTSRQRNVAMPELLCCVLSDLKTRKRFTAPEDFVLPSRCGTPISQDNVATRRLKSIGNTLAMPWLSWYVFHRTHVSLYCENGRHLQKELKRAITLEKVIVRHP
jgi:integrase